MSDMDWQSIFANECTESVTLEHAGDGKTLETRAIVIEKWSLPGTPFRHDAVNCTFIVPAGTFRLYPGDRIIYCGRSLDIAQVQLCKTLSGEVIAQRCTIVN